MIRAAKILAKVKYNCKSAIISESTAISLLPVPYTGVQDGGQGKLVIVCDYLRSKLTCFK